MKINDSSLLDKLSSNPKRLFLIDSLGAFISAFLLGIVLTHFTEYVGIPKKVLIGLSLLAIVIGIYSMICHFFIRYRWHSFLFAIFIVNLLYCILTIAVVFYFFESITICGAFYFIGEITLIGILAFIELKTVQMKRVR